MYKTKRDMVVDLLDIWGTYSPDAPNQPYSMRLLGKFFCSHDTAELADQLEAAFSRDELTGALS